MQRSTYFLVVSFLIITIATYAQPTAPDGKKWVKVEAMSDEFNGTTIDAAKWIVNDPQWQGRRPARFELFAVAVKEGSLQVTASKKTNPTPEWTHNGGLVRSKMKNRYGYYEARMKANKTFMSSTFWLINKRNEFTGCDFRTTELDVTETVGVNSGGASWIDNTITGMNSNTHSRGTTCDETPIGMAGDKENIGEAAYLEYHTYGVWWKNEKECLFYLDGKLVYEINPAADFNLAMYLRMVVETYDWNPPKDGQDGMNDTAENRTTYYDWVHSYDLVDNDVATTDEVKFLNAPITVPSKQNYTFDISYTAAAEREIVVEFWSATNWIASGIETVAAGTGTKSVTVNLPNAPEPATGYSYKVHTRPVGSTWRDAVANDQINNATVEAFLSVEDENLENFTTYPIPSTGKITINTKNGERTKVDVYDLFGKNVYSKQIDTSVIDLSVLPSAMYLMRVNQGNKTVTTKIIIDKK